MKNVETNRYYLLAMIIIFIVSRFYFSNLNFDLESIYSHWQILDIGWLQNDLLGSLYHLHSQPPFYNFLIGIFAKLFPENYMQALSALQLLMSFVIYGMLFYLLLFFRVPVWLSFMVATLYILSPEALLYERWIFYTWFNTFLLVSATFLLVVYLEKRRSVYLLLFFLVVAILMLTRSMFHLIYLPGIIFILVMMDQEHWKKIIIFSMVPFLLVGSIYLKNYLNFGFFGGSSWLGMNISKVASHSTLDHSLGELMQMPFSQKEEEMNKALKKLYDEGKIHSPMLVGGFKPLNAYASEYQKEVPNYFSNIPSLTVSSKTNGYRNMNHHNYIAISMDMKKDAFVIISENPMGYIRTVVMAMMNYIRPAWDYVFVEENAKKIERYIQVFELNYLGGTLKEKYGLISVLLVPLGILIALLYTALLVLNKTDEKGLVALYMLYNILFVLGIGVLVEIGELNRMRVMTDPLLLILAVAALMQGVRYIFKTKEKSTGSV